MREMKFRGQRVDNKEWIIGDLCKSISGAPCIMPSAFFATREFEDVEEDKPQVISDSLAIGGFFPVIPETVGQYAGLKDKNEVEIYEGDIVKKNHLVPLIGMIVYKTESARFWVSIPKVGQNDDWTFIGDNCEIIGNIYSNPELLK